VKKSDRLKLIVDLNADQEKKALEAFGQIQQKQIQLQEQIDGLKNYRLETLAKFDLNCATGARIGQMLEFRSFIEKLDKAIQGQEQALTQLEVEVSRARHNWLNLHNRTENLEKISDKALKMELKEEDKREQLEQDDRVSSGRRGGTRNA